MIFMSDPDTQVFTFFGAYFKWNSIECDVKFKGMSSLFCILILYPEILPKSFNSSIRAGKLVSG